MIPILFVFELCVFLGQDVHISYKVIINQQPISIDYVILLFVYDIYHGRTMDLIELTLNTPPPL